jgi:hypothetical protein
MSQANNLLQNARKKNIVAFVNIFWQYSHSNLFFLRLPFQVCNLVSVHLALLNGGATGYTSHSEAKCFLELPLNFYLI